MEGKHEGKSQIDIYLFLVGRGDRAAKDYVDKYNFPLSKVFVVDCMSIFLFSILPNMYW